MGRYLGGETEIQGRRNLKRGQEAPALEDVPRGSMGGLWRPGELSDPVTLMDVVENTDAHTSLFVAVSP